MQEQELANNLADENEDFRKLSEEHSNLKQLLKEFNERVYLSADEEMERKRIQKLKLLKKDSMAKMLMEYKEKQNLN